MAQSKKPWCETEKELFNDYVDELRKARDKKRPLPLHLYSKRVYRAYRNAWRYIDRKLLTPDEIKVMLQLGIYKPSLTELGVRGMEGSVMKEACKVRVGYV
jgi:hypothetical protein